MSLLNSDLENLDAVRSALPGLISRPTDAPEPILDILRRWDEAWVAIAGRVPPGAFRPRVFIEEWHQPPRVAQQWVPDLVRRAGGEPFMLTPGTTQREVSWEEVLEFDPHIVLLSHAGLGVQVDPAQWMAIEGWNRVDAAEHGRIFSVDDRLFNTPGMALTEGARLLQGLMGEAFWGWPWCEDRGLRRLQGFGHEI